VNEHIPVRADPPSIIDRDDFVEMRFLPSLCQRDIGPTAENKKGLHVSGNTGGTVRMPPAAIWTALCIKRTKPGTPSQPRIGGEA